MNEGPNDRRRRSVFPGFDTISDGRQRIVEKLVADPDLSASGRAEDVALTVSRHRQQLDDLHSLVLSAEARHYGLVGAIVVPTAGRQGPM